MGIDRGGGKTIRNDECHFGGSARPLFEQLPRRAVETSTEIGAAQIRKSVRSRRAQPNGLEPALAEFGNDPFGIERSEERRVGRECRSRWSPSHSKKKRSR